MSSAESAHSNVSVKPEMNINISGPCIVKFDRKI